MSVLPFYLLQRHPLAVKAHFVRSLVLTYAFPREVLGRMLPPGLMLDSLRDRGFVAIAMVQTESLRPSIMPREWGQPFFLAGYRIFTRFKSPDGVTRRGLYILRSDTDRRLMAVAGNLLTHYRYQVSEVATSCTEGTFRCRITTRNAQADLDVTADLRSPGQLPAGSFFESPREARRFAGPLPYTFDFERETHSIIAIKAQRQNWNPRLVEARVELATLFEHDLFAGVRPPLASAFCVENIDYRWNRGMRYSLN